MIQLRRYNDGQDGVGEWHFELPAVGILPQTEAGLRRALSAILELAQALRTDDFFEFTHLRVDRWAVIDQATQTRRFENKTCEFSAAELAAALAKPAAALVQGDAEFWHPTDAVMEGLLRVVLPEQELRLPQAFSVRVAFTGAFTFSLVTDCDAWLSHDLLGRPQDKIMALNLPRLEKMLATVSDHLGMEPDVEHTPYAFLLPDGIESKHEEEGEYNVVDEPERWILHQWVM